MTESEVRRAYEAHSDSVHGFVWRMTGSQAVAEDITQDVFASLLAKPDRFDATRGRMRPFLLGMARNLLLKLRRDENRWDAFDEEQFAAPPPDIAGREIAAIVNDAIQALPPLQREVIILSQYEGFSLGEIANQVAADVGTVKSRLHRARDNLRRMLAPLKGVMVTSRPYGTAER